MGSNDRGIFRLYLLRHAHAAWPLPGTSDFDRPLDAKGQSEARSVALQVFTAGIFPEIIVSSPARRCAETTAAFLEIFGNLTANYDGRLYSEGPDVYIDHIRAHEARGSLLLVGHNPMIEALAHSLSRPGDVGAGLAYGYPTAGFLALEFPNPLPATLMHKGEARLLLEPALT